jgi:hypothetical protein
VAGLLIGIRHLSMAGVPRDELRAACILLTACGVATLALNIAGPVTVGAYGWTAFDSVGPGLLIGWAETGPGMLRFLYARPRNPEQTPPAEQAPIPPHSEADSPAEASVPSRSRIDQVSRVRAAGLDELLDQAQQIDREHRLQYHRPVSAETLRKQVRVGSMRARTLVRMVRESRDPT